MKKQVKKLTLNRETINGLEAQALRAAGGGSDSAECITLNCGFSWWTCGLSGCANACTYND